MADEICKVRSSGVFNVEFMRIEELADRLFEATPNKPDKPSMTRLVASEMVYNATSALETPGPLTEHANNESTLSAIQRTLQALERLDIGVDRALLRLANGASDGLYAQLIEIQGSYAASATGFLTRGEQGHHRGRNRIQQPRNRRFSLSTEHHHVAGTDTARRVFAPQRLCARAIVDNHFSDHA